MASSPHPPPSPNLTFVGREKEIQDLDQALADEAVRVVVVSGARGVGKTTLAAQLYLYHRDHGNLYDATHYLPGHDKPPYVLLDDLGRLFKPSVSVRQRPQDLPALVVDAIAGDKDRHLILVDNIEEQILADSWREFIQRFAVAPTRTTLVVTSRVWPAEIPADNRAIYHLRLTGLTEPGAVLLLLGDALRYQFSRDELLTVARRLGNIPQRLLYMRWAQPGSVTEFAARFLGDGQLASIAALRNVLQGVSAADAFVACGLLRSIEYPEHLLEFLWDHHRDTADGSFADFVIELLNLRLITPASDSQVLYRMHPEVHLDLRRLAEKRGRHWARTCNSIALDYFRLRWQLDRDDLSALAEAVHHALALGNFDEAYEFVFGEDRVESWRHLGLSLRLEPLLEQLDAAARALAGHYSQLRHAEILIALAHVASDLGRPTLCLDHLNNALVRLDGAPRSPSTDAVLRRAWMQMAISHANVGNTAKCIDYYLQVIRSDEETTEPRTALCMGYLGYEFCDFQDFDNALMWTARALDACPLDRDASVFAKNLCNRGIVLYYHGDLTAASECMERAVKLVAEPSSPAADVREHGRALSHLAMVYSARPEIPDDRIEQLLRQSLRLTRSGGDARRSALTTARLGLLAARKGEYHRARELLDAAIITHQRLGDTRNMTFELLNLAAVCHAESTGRMDGSLAEILDTAGSAAVSDQVRTLMAAITTRVDLRYLVDFWHHCHQPRSFHVWRK